MEVINSYPELAAAVNVMAPFPVRLTVNHGPPQLHQVESTVTTALTVAPLTAVVCQAARPPTGARREGFVW